MILELQNVRTAAGAAGSSAPLISPAPHLTSEEWGGSEEGSCSVVQVCVTWLLEHWLGLPLCWLFGTYLC